MLILTKKIGEAIILDDDIEITIIDIQGNHAKIGARSDANYAALCLHRTA